MNQDARLAHGPGHGLDLGKGHALVDELQETIVRHFEATSERDAAAVGELLAEFRREGFSKRTLPHQLTARRRFKISSATAVNARRRRLVDEMEPAAARLFHEDLHGVHDAGGGSARSGQCSQGGVAEAAFFPVAAMGTVSFNQQASPTGDAWVQHLGK